MVQSKKINWIKDAACKTSNPLLFLSYDIEDIEKAKAICKNCSVKKICGSSFDHVHCVAGGLTLLERMKNKRKRITSLDDIKWG